MREFINTANCDVIPMAMQLRRPHQFTSDKLEASCSTENCLCCPFFILIEFEAYSFVAGVLAMNYRRFRKINLGFVSLTNDVRNVVSTVAPFYAAQTVSVGVILRPHVLRMK